MENRVAVLLGVLVALLAATRVADADADGVVEKDRIRIQEHLSGVESYLRSQDTSHLGASQRAVREENIDRLHEYWVAGVFPHNTITTHATPIFVDPEGRACAVGYLMLEAGYKDAVTEIASTQNLAYVNDIDSSEVVAWLEESGLTAQEAAWIQPQYNPCNDDCDCEADPVCDADGVTYVSSCFAEECYGVMEYSRGCCEVVERIAWSGDLVTDLGGSARLCDGDPNDRTAELCDEGVIVLPPLTESDGEACAAGHLPDESRWSHIALLIALFSFSRLRRRSPRGEGRAQRVI